jgi:peptidylprolyl isomerase
MLQRVLPQNWAEILNKEIYVRGVEKLMVLLLLAMAIIIPACAQKDAKSTGENVPALQPQNKSGSQSQAAAVRTASGLAYQETRVGTSGCCEVGGHQS